MAKNNLNFDAVENGERVPRWRSREPDPTVQMSIRMHASIYAEFRNLCKDERRTNGAMLEIMMKEYKARKR